MNHLFFTVETYKALIKSKNNYIVILVFFIFDKSLVFFINSRLYALFIYFSISNFSTS